MRKITSLLMLLCMFVGMAWAENFPFKLSGAENKYYYYIKSGRDNDGKTWWFTYTADDAKIALTQFDESDAQLWYFMEVEDADKTYLQIFPKAGEGKAMSYENSNSDPGKVVAKELGTEGWNNTWTFVTTEGATPYAFKTSDDKNYLSNNGGVSYKMGMWNASPKDDKGSAIYILSSEEIMADYIKTAEDLINDAKVGTTEPGYFTSESIASLNAAIESAKIEEQKGNYITVKLREAIDAFRPIMPQEGKFYVIEAPLFYSKQGISKGLCVTDNKLTWNTIDLKDKNYYWNVEINDGKFALKNVATGKYIKNTGEFADAPNYGSLNYLSQQQFNIIIGDHTFHANGHGGGVNANGSVINYDGGVNSASSWQLIEKPNPDLVVTVNYSFKYNGVEKYTQSAGGFVGEEYPDVTISLPLGVEAAKPDGKIAQEDVEDHEVNKVINLTFSELPFKESESFDKAVWQVIDMHSNEANYTWKYVAKDANVELPVIAKEQTKSLGNEFYWAFVGNRLDGYKIYNKAAGNTLTLRKAENGNSVSVMSETDSRNVFLPHASSKIEGAYCWMLNGDDFYLNTQIADGVKILKGWSATDEGSSCRSFSPASFVLSTLEQFMETEIPNGAVGSPEPQLVDAVNTAYAASKANEYDVDKLVALETAVATLLASHNTMPTDGIYRIQNVYRKQMIGYNGTNRVKTDIGKTDVSQLWEIKTVEGKVVVRNLNADAYMKAPSGGNTLVPEAEAAKFDLKPLGLAQYTFTVDASNLVIFAGGDLGGWSDNPLNSDGAWYIIPATELDIAVGEAGWGTTYLPFDVVVPNTVKAYAVTETNSEWATLTEKSDIPANQGAILEGKGTHTLTIGKANSDWSDNLLTGTTVNSYVDDENAYVLAMPKDEPIGFYKAKLNKNETGADGNTHFLNNANKAYLSVPTAGEARFLSFDFAAETAIDELKGENGNVKTVIYDLAGRRVQKVQKGLYIVNGVKVIK